VFLYGGNSGFAYFWSSTAAKDTGDAYIFGVYFYAAIIDSIPTHKEEGHSVRCIKGGSSSGIQDQTIIDKISVYPSVCSNLLQIRSSENITAIFVYNINGVEMLKTTSHSNELKLNISTLQNGIYFVRVNSGKQSGTYKIIKK
jgi:hypothetical protein